MTRVNVVPVSELYDQHLVAEYRELPMVGRALQRSLRSKNGFDRRRINSEYTLNKGHVMFFYDKGLYLLKRYAELVDEMRARGMNPDPRRRFNIEDFPEEFRNDWTPNQKAMKINRERINLRLTEKPDFYRKTESLRVVA